MKFSERIERWSIDRLKPYDRNARTHSPDQVAKIAASFTEFGFINPVVVEPGGVIVAGHGRVEAAKLLGLPEVPVIVVEHLTDMQRRAYILADNRLADLAGWDVQMLRDELAAIDAESDGLLDAAGFTDDELNAFFGDGVLPDGTRLENDGEKPKPKGPEYSKKIKAPIYEPKGERPPLEALTNRAKAEKLAAEIRAAKGITEQEREFLLLAAGRHVVFDYHQIAEYYCHASKRMQELMEDSALVIIDFDKAIERGYVELSEKINAIYFQSFGDEDEDDALDVEFI